MVGVIGLGVLQGVMIAIGASVVYLLARESRPKGALRGRIPGRDGFYKLHREHRAKGVPGLAIYLVQGAYLRASVSSRKSYPLFRPARGEVEALGMRPSSRQPPAATARRTDQPFDVLGVGRHRGSFLISGRHRHSELHGVKREASVCVNAEQTASPYLRFGRLRP
jgi:hypothetical protein